MVGKEGMILDWPFLCRPEVAIKGMGQVSQDEDSDENHNDAECLRDGDTYTDTIGSKNTLGSNHFKATLYNVQDQIGGADKTR